MDPVIRGSSTPLLMFVAMRDRVSWSRVTEESQPEASQESAPMIATDFKAHANRGRFRSSCVKLIIERPGSVDVTFVERR